MDRIPVPPDKTNLRRTTPRTCTLEVTPQMLQNMTPDRRDFIIELLAEK
ncbi:hypothetical protein IH574_05415 [Candidatus Bathyarchaeota archaeon]|nr:hypothetical protein [Candidatus Bathyarchaeota archaeon]